MGEQTFTVLGKKQTQLLQVLLITEIEQKTKQYAAYMYLNISIHPASCQEDKTNGMFLPCDNFCIQIETGIMCLLLDICWTPPSFLVELGDNKAPPQPV